MILLLIGGGLRYNDKATAIGAQTERRGLAGPVRALLGGVCSPAAFFQLWGEPVLQSVFRPISFAASSRKLWIRASLGFWCCIHWTASS